MLLRLIPSIHPILMQATGLNIIKSKLLYRKIVKLGRIFWKKTTCKSVMVVFLGDRIDEIFAILAVMDQIAIYK